MKVRSKNGQQEEIERESMTHTQSKDTSQEESDKQQGKGQRELGVLIHGREEWTASSSLPDLMQRRIHRLRCGGN
jgi:hypothetical protein